MSHNAEPEFNWQELEDQRMEELQESVRRKIERAEAKEDETSVIL